MVEIKWTTQAIDDLNNIAEFISKDSRKYARLFIEKIFDRSEILITHPKSGRIVPEVKDQNIREWSSALTGSFINFTTNELIS